MLRKIARFVCMVLVGLYSFHPKEGYLKKIVLWYLYFSQIWLNLPVEFSQFGYITKLRRGKGGGGGSMAKTLLLVFFGQLCAAKQQRQSLDDAACNWRGRIYLAVNDKARKRLARQKWVPVPKKQQQWVNFKLIMEQTGAQHSSSLCACCLPL